MFNVFKYHINIISELLYFKCSSISIFCRVNFIKNAKRQKAFASQQRSVGAAKRRK